MPNVSLATFIPGATSIQESRVQKWLFLYYFDIQNNFGTQHVLQMLRASEKDLPVMESISKKNSKMLCTLLGHIASEWLSLLHNFCGSVGLAALVFDAPFDISTRSR